jgi:hypothetical protein
MKRESIVIFRVKGLNFRAKSWHLNCLCTIHSRGGKEERGDDLTLSSALESL